MTIDDKNKKLPNNISKEEAKISTLLSGNNHKYYHLASKEILPFNQSQRMEQAKASNSPLGKTFEKNKNN